VFAEYSLTADQVAALEAHLELLMRWNQKLNLTAIRNRQEAIDRHYGESLFLGSHLPVGPLRIVDIGSGAGFPGFPVAVLRPDCSVTLVESHQRKAVFLREATRNLPNVRVVAKRAEQVAESFDLAVSRAVSYEDLVPVLKKLALRADLLTGGEEPPATLGFVWELPRIVPGSNSRFLRKGKLVFHVKQD
jgi:16S rRNA (guanine527-N7)-methyltransferase